MEYFKRHRKGFVWGKKVRELKVVWKGNCLEVDWCEYLVRKVLKKLKEIEVKIDVEDTA